MFILGSNASSCSTDRSYSSDDDEYINNNLLTDKEESDEEEKEKELGDESPDISAEFLIPDSATEIKNNIDSDKKILGDKYGFDRYYSKKKIPSDDIEIDELNRSYYILQSLYKKFAEKNRYESVTDSTDSSDSCKQTIISDEDVEGLLTKYQNELEVKEYGKYSDPSKTNIESDSDSDHLLGELRRETERIDLIYQFHCSRQVVPFVELLLPEDQVVEEVCGDPNKRRKRLQKFFKWAVERYCGEHEAKRKIRNTVYELLGEELREHQKKFELKNSIRMKEKLTKLPEVRNQLYLLDPHRDTTPVECLERFYTGSMYIGTANVFGLNGHGTYVYPNGAVYVGHFKDNMCHGLGFMLYPNKTIVEGCWYKGELLEPRIIYEDGMEYDAHNWEYLNSNDRRYTSEKTRGLLPDNDPQLTNEHPARALPAECYDTGEGFYSAKTKLLYHPITGKILRVPSIEEAEWIVNNCRGNEDPKVSFSQDYFPAQYDVEMEPNELVIDPHWYNINFPELNYEEGKKIRSEIIKDLSDENQLPLCKLRNLRVPPLKNKKPANEEDWTNIPKRKYITPQYVLGLPLSVIKLLFLRKEIPCNQVDDSKVEKQLVTEEQEQEEEAEEEEHYGNEHANVVGYSGGFSHLVGGNEGQMEKRRHGEFDHLGGSSAGSNKSDEIIDGEPWPLGRSGEEEAEDEDDEEKVIINQISDSFALKKFIRTLHVIHEFIEGEDIEWNVELENDIQECLKVLQLLDLAVIKRKIRFNKQPITNDRRLLKTLLSLWLSYGKKLKDLDRFRDIARKICRYKLSEKLFSDKSKKLYRRDSSFEEEEEEQEEEELLEETNVKEQAKKQKEEKGEKEEQEQVEEESTTSSCKSLYEIYPYLQMRKTRYQSVKTRKRIANKKYVVKTDAPNRY